MNLKEEIEKKEEAVEFMLEELSKPVVASNTELYFTGTWVCRTTPDGIEINTGVPLKDKIKCILKYGWRPRTWIGKKNIK